MNANELADKLLENNAVSWGDCTYEQHDNDKYFKTEAATMLRKQQTDLDIALSYMKQYELQIKQLQVAYEQEQYRSKQWQERFESGRLT